MFKFKRHKRSFSRLMIGLFAMQVLAAGLCLMAPESHAAKIHATNSHDMQMPASGPVSADMASHCDSRAKAASDDAEQNSACVHCDQPGELVQSKVSAFNVDVELPLSILLSSEIDIHTPTSIDFSIRTPTGPPRSSSLLYQTSQRILI